MPFVSTMILRSMRMTGEKIRGATLTTDEQTECLAELNTMMESWQTERLMCYALTENSLALTASTSSYTIGTNGTFAVTRPTRIVDPCFVRDSSGYDTPITLVSKEVYGRVVDKDAGFTVPTHLFYDGEFTATSTATIFLYPSPSGSLTLFINSWKQLQSFANVSTNMLLPPGYQLAIESNFAVHLAAGLTEISNELARLARDSKAAVKSLNLPSTVSRLDSGVVSHRATNILTGP